MNLDWRMSFWSLKWTGFSKILKNRPISDFKTTQVSQTHQNLSTNIFEISKKFCVDWYIIWCTSSKLKIFLYYRWQNLQVADDRRWRWALKIAEKSVLFLYQWSLFPSVWSEKSGSIGHPKRHKTSGMPFQEECISLLPGGSKKGPVFENPPRPLYWTYGLFLVQGHHFTSEWWILKFLGSHNFI